MPAIFARFAGIILRSKENYLSKEKIIIQMTTSTLTSRGQTTIPKSVRRHLGLQRNQRLSYEMRDGCVIMRPVEQSLDHLVGLLHSSQPPASKEEERQSVSEALGKAYEEGH